MSLLMLLSGSGSGGSPPVGPFDPAELPWGPTAIRFWWNYLQPNGLSVNADGSGGMPAIGDPIGAILSGSDSAYSYYLSKAFAAAMTRHEDGIRYPAGNPLYWKDPFPGGALFYPGTTGLTMGFRVKMLSGAFYTDAGVVAGYDGSPRYMAAGVEAGTKTFWLAGNSGQQVTGDYDGLVTDSATIITTFTPTGGGNVTAKIYINGVLANSATLVASGGMNRDLIYPGSSNANFILQSRFLGEGDFDANVSDINNFLIYGAP